jgi:hypothetical protein
VRAPRISVEHVVWNRWCDLHGVRDGARVRQEHGAVRLRRNELPKWLLQRGADGHVRALRLSVQHVVWNRRCGVHGVWNGTRLQQEHGAMRLRRDELLERLLQWRDDGHVRALRISIKRVMWDGRSDVQRVWYTAELQYRPLRSEHVCAYRQPDVLRPCNRNGDKHACRHLGQHSRQHLSKFRGGHAGDSRCDEHIRDALSLRRRYGGRRLLGNFSHVQFHDKRIGDSKHHC